MNSEEATAAPTGKRRRHVLIATAVAIAVALAGIVTMLAQSVIATGQTVPTVAMAHQRLGLLATARRGVDHVPDGARLERAGDGGIDPMSTRYLGSDGAGRYWAGVDNAANVCLIAENWGEGATSACVSPDRFAVTGVSVTVEGRTPMHYVEAYLLPDGVDAGPATSSTLHPVAKNLLTGDSRKVGHVAVELPNHSGRGSEKAFTLHLMPAATE